MTPNEPPQSPPNEMRYSDQLRVRYLWVVLGIYVVGFIAFVANDLYSDQITQGLYTVHRTPFLHPYGNVIDPKPEQSLNQELGLRLNLDPSDLPTDWFAQMSNRPEYIVDRTIRQPAHNEVLLGRVNDDETVVVLGEYHGEWVTFRPTIGVLIEPRDPLTTMNAAVIVRVTAP